MAGLALLLAACGPVPSTSPQVLQDDSDQELSEAVLKRLDQLEGRSQGLSKRLDQLAEKLEPLQERQSELDDLRKRIERLKQAVQELKGNTQVNGKEIDRMSDQLQRIYTGWEGRLEQVEEQQGLLLDQLRARGLELEADGGPNASAAQEEQRTTQAGEEEPLSASAPPKKPDKPPKPSPEEQKRQQEANDARQAYQEAFQLVKDGDYVPAREALRKFLGNYPGSEYADNAQYWLAETHYVMGEHESALEEFQAVMEEYPKSSKVPAAKLKKGYSYYELEDYRQARKELIEVMDEFPDHRVAGLAKQQLEKIRKEQF